MPIATQVLTIIELVLRLALQIAQDMPPEMRTAHWERVQRDLKFWQDLFDKVKDATT